jgi:ABC-type transport system involved in cytochrome c biogenesis permease subunit
MLFGRGSDTLTEGVLAFSAIIILVSAVICKRRAKMDKSGIAMYVVLIAWASLLFSLFLAKYAR